MTRMQRLQAEVDRRWTGLEMPSWPDPHTGGRDSFDEEYSRVSHPARYRIVHARARLRAQVLAEHGARTVELTPRPVPAWPDTDPAPVDRLLRVDPPSGAAGALPLYLCETDGSEAETGAVVGNQVGHDDGRPPGTAVPPSLGIAWGTTDAVLQVQPDCGCDACDTGSADLLEAVDDTICNALTDTVRLAGRRRGRVRTAERDWQLTWHADGTAQGSGEMPGGRGLRRHQRDRDARWRMRAACERIVRGEDVRLPRGTQVTVGRAWFPQG
jgi:hypothetical protein